MFLIFLMSLGLSPYLLKHVWHITLPFPPHALQINRPPYVMYIPSPQFGHGTALVHLADKEYNLILWIWKLTYLVVWYNFIVPKSVPKWSSKIPICWSSKEVHWNDLQGAIPCIASAIVVIRPRLGQGRNYPHLNFQAVKFVVVGWFC